MSGAAVTPSGQSTMTTADGWLMNVTALRRKTYVRFSRDGDKSTVKLTMRSSPDTARRVHRAIDRMPTHNMSELCAILGWEAKHDA